MIKDGAKMINAVANEGRELARLVVALRRGCVVLPDRLNDMRIGQQRWRRIRTYRANELDGGR